ncbi:MAG: ATP-dependent RNA helicase HrpA [Nocardioidaceae bacterium]
MSDAPTRPAPGRPGQAPYTISYPDELPVSQRREDIAAVIRDHQVVIVAGETGSGKTTQLPKICLELGRGADGRVIGHTQPRRIAARSVAERIAEELGTPLGEVVGYTIRFTDRSSTDTQVKVMTDGILLAEIQRDRMLRRYDTIIIDEAHERSLNIDFLLGYLKELLPKRPDLKVIITSATIDPDRFSRHFGDAPVVEVSGRTYPVEVRYRPLEDDQTQGILDAVDELMREGSGDILVFLSGEREIRDAADALRKVKPRRVVDEFEVLPLYARLSRAEQHRVFAPHNRRRVVLATNVAETSLTVPGIHYVVDTGLARISRYSARTKVQRLPIEPISRASADQRKGRCGRVADGICIRLYAEEDFSARPEFTEPEILRTNLAAVILQMTALGLGDIARFPFVEPPDTRSVTAGLQLLEEIGAITSSRSRRPRLTAIGRRLARLPIDPRLGRMMLAADELGCFREVVVIVAALSIQDPRERPTDAEEQADAKHRRFADPGSDFAAYLNLWRYLKEQQRDLSSSAFRRLCKADFLNYLRVREWQDLDAQLRQVAKQIGLHTSKVREPGPRGNDTVDPHHQGRGSGSSDLVHRALLTGLLSHVGLKDLERRDYLGARGTRFAIFPGSGLFKKQPELVMAAELVETGRLWARVNARIEAEWVEAAGGDLLKRSYSEPHWSKRRGAVVAYEKVTLYGVPIVSERPVNYGRIDPETARELFIRHALVQGEWRTQHRFFRDNQRLLDEAEQLEHRARRRDIVVDDEVLFDFYDARVPADVVSVAHFDAWWKAARRRTPDLLDLTWDLLVNEGRAEVARDEFPDVWEHQDGELPLAYAFEPGSAADGVTVDIPVTTLTQLDPAEFTWPVPGLRQELVTALLRSLPKHLRVNFVPAPDHARSFLAATPAGQESLLDALERHLRRTTGVHVPRGSWDLTKVPTHVLPSFRVLGADGEVLGEGKDLAVLKARLGGVAGSAVADVGAPIERSGITAWDFDEVPREFARTRAGHTVRGYPALVDEGASAAIRVQATEAGQEAQHRRGVRRLLMLGVSAPGPTLVKQLDNAAKLTLGLAPHGSIGVLLEDCFAAAVDAIVEERGGPAWIRWDFDRLRDAVASQAMDRTREVLRLVGVALTAAAEVDRRLTGRAELALLPALADMKTQAGRLVHPGFVAEAGMAALRHYPRYYAAIGLRLDKLPGDPGRDAVLMGSVAGVQASYLHQVEALPQGMPPPPELVRVRWMIEELRVSLWGQELRTAHPVSTARVEKALADL